MPIFGSSTIHHLNYITKLSIGAFFLYYCELPHAPSFSPPCPNLVRHIFQERAGACCIIIISHIICSMHRSIRGDGQRTATSRIRPPRRICTDNLPKNTSGGNKIAIEMHFHNFRGSVHSEVMCKSCKLAESRAQ